MLKIILILVTAVALTVGPAEMSLAAKRPTYTITVTVGANGSVTPKKARLKQGASKNLIIKPRKKYMVDALIVNGVYQDGIPQKLGKPYTLRLKKISQDTKVNVTFDTQRNPKPTASGLEVGSQVSVVDAK